MSDGFEQRSMRASKAWLTEIAECVGRVVCLFHAVFFDDRDQLGDRLGPPQIAQEADGGAE